MNSLDTAILSGVTSTSVVNQQNNILQKHMHRIQHIHFVGIGGSGMNVIAEVMLGLGYDISGSDMASSKVTKRLERLGVQVFIGHNASNVTGVDLVVRSTAVKDDNPEVVAAHSTTIPVISRAEMLAEIMRFRYGIAVSGTHGKTTTTSMLASVLTDAGLSPSYLIGGILNREQTGAKLGSGQYLVAEADESDASFLNLTPMMSIVLNIDEDHMDTYAGDVEQLKKTFVQFVDRMPFYGLAVVCLDDEKVVSLLESFARPLKSYSLEHKHADIFADNIEVVGTQTHFDLWVSGKARGRFTVNMPGRHNVANALAVIAVALELEVDLSVIGQSLAQFAGVGRRFTHHGQVHGIDAVIPVYEDYGHHPREIAALLEAARAAFPQRSIVGVFQPHRYSRTRDLFDDFVQVLAKFDKLVLAEVYAAGEEPIITANSKALAQAIRARKLVEPVWVEKLDTVAHTTRELLSENDVVLVMGAGSIGQVAQTLCQAEPTT